MLYYILCSQRSHLEYVSPYVSDDVMSRRANWIQLGKKCYLYLS